MTTIYFSKWPKFANDQYFLINLLKHGVHVIIFCFVLGHMTIWISWTKWPILASDQISFVKSLKHLVCFPAGWWDTNTVNYNFLLIFVFACMFKQMYVLCATFCFTLSLKNVSSLSLLMMFCNVLYLFHFIVLSALGCVQCIQCPPKGWW